MSLAIFEDPVWQMSAGERAAVEGVLSQLQPDLAIEIGSMEGACLRRIAAHAKEAHSFDLSPPTLEMPGNVTLHTGDSHVLLPGYLAELQEQSRNVDLVLVDGDHSPDGVRRDIEDLLDSRALARTVILIHDTANEGVRAGLDAVHFAAWPKVAHVELDWVPGRLFAQPALRHQLWFGLGLVVVDAARTAYGGREVYEPRYEPSASLLATGRDLLVARARYGEPPMGAEGEAGVMSGRVAGLLGESSSAYLREAQLRDELVTLRDRLEGAERALENIKASVSWRMTEPLRAAKGRSGRRPKR